MTTVTVEQAKTQFLDLEHGDVFVSHGDAFTKLAETLRDTAGEEGNAVMIASGGLYKFEDDTEVIKASAINVII